MNLARFWASQLIESSLQLYKVENGLSCFFTDKGQYKASPEVHTGL